MSKMKTKYFLITLSTTLLFAVTLIYSCKKSNTIKSNSEISTLKESFDIGLMKTTIGNEDLLPDFNSSNIQNIKNFEGIERKFVVTPLKNKKAEIKGILYSYLVKENKFINMIFYSDNYINGNGTLFIRKLGSDQGVILTAKNYSVENVLSKNFNPNFKAKSGEFEVSESCTGRCYRLAKAACDSDGDCRILCDFSDSIGGCSGSIYAACFIDCL